MTDREKALEAALRECRIDLMIAAGNADEAARTDSRWDGVGEKLRVRVREAYAALAMPATVDGASWTPPEDRPDGYVCLGLVPVTWHGEVMEWRDGVMEQVEPLGFAPAPEDAP
jgi:hypothetical protein